MKAIINGNVFLNGTFHKDKVIAFDKEITAIFKKEEIKTMRYDKVIDAENLCVVPGFIDVHIHGYNNCDVMDSNLEAIAAIQEGVVTNGVTSILPTTMSMSLDRIQSVLDIVKSAKRIERTNGADIIGVHLEGPFINKAYKGAQYEKYITDVDKNFIDKYQDILKIVTLAPEVQGALDLIDHYKDKINFSIGHSGADYEIARKALTSGAKSVTHLFNCMSPLHHRNPGVVGTAFTSDCYCELIADNFHVNQKLYQMILNLKGKKRMLLITDCIRASGFDEGYFDLGGQTVKVEDNKCMLEDGTIAGSVLKLNKAAHNFYKHTNCNLEDIVPMITSNQAEYLGMDDKIGEIAVGKQADLVIMDEDFNIMKTIVKGNVAYEI